jgi:hypothetical protein
MIFQPFLLFKYAAREIQKMGLDETDLVALQGTQTFGRVQC